MQLNLQNFTTLLQSMSASVQGASVTLLDLTVGSVLRAILEANASIALWLQWLIVQVLATTRLATSTGSDCDSFGADFGFSRLPAVAAVGTVTFSRFTPGIAAFIPVGSVVSTASNIAQFIVVPDPTNSAFDAVTNGYDVANGLASVNARVVAEAAGTSGNVIAGAITMLSSAISGIDTVSNAVGLTGGADAESDAAFRVRFENYLSSLSKATNLAISAAISGIQQGLTYSINENIDQTGNRQPGHFVVTIDDGSGNPPSTLLTTVQLAVDAIRPIGSTFAVQGPIVCPADISVTLVTESGTAHAAAVAAVAAAFETYISALTIGATLSYTRLAQLAYSASSSVINLVGLTLNNSSSDLVPPQFGVVRSGTVAVA